MLKRDSSEALLAGANPLPQVEFDFWRARADNLDSIYEQLSEDRVKKMAQLLEKSNSSYYVAFKEIFTEVVAGTECTGNLKQRVRL